jgi:hypothetical protein
MTDFVKQWDTWNEVVFNGAKIPKKTHEIGPHWWAWTEIFEHC